MSKQKTVATRVHMHEIAKAYDGLIASGVPASKLTTTSQILRACILMMAIKTNDPKGPASPEAIEFFKQVWQRTKMTKNINLGNLMEE